MLNNAWTYNQEGSWVYVDAGEMEKVFDATLARVTAKTDLPGATPLPSQSVASASGSYESALTPMDDEHPQLAQARSMGRKQVLNDDEYLMNPSDEERVVGVTGCPLSLVVCHVILCIKCPFRSYFLSCTK